MNNTSVVDNVYLALELTKITYNNYDNIEDKKIFDSYMFFVEKLTKIPLDEICDIPKLKEQLFELKHKYNIVCDTFNERVSDTLKSNNEKTLEYLELVKGDMESYVYKELKDRLSKNNF